MPLPVFEVACVLIVLLALAAMARARPLSDLLIDYFALAVAGFLGEETCILFYDYYHYAAGFHLRLDRVPVLVPLIWPLVILSARDVARSLWPGLSRARPLVVGAIVAFDASLVEVVAVRAGLWSWADAGHLGVPLIGILGWGYFAIGADVALSGHFSFGRAGRLSRAAGAIVLGPLAAHALLQLTWWPFFRWAQRSALGDASLVGISFLGLVILALALRARRRGGAIPFGVALPRMVAAGLFLVLLVATAPDEVRLWIHTAAVAIPYLAATALPRGKRALSLRAEELK